MNVLSKYPEAADDKISLGPVFAVNPRYVRQIEIVNSGDVFWLAVQMVGKTSLTTELETEAFVRALTERFKAANPDIEVVHHG